jgi:hypothetical protein
MGEEGFWQEKNQKWINLKLCRHPQGKEGLEFFSGQRAFCVSIDCEAP